MVVAGFVESKLSIACIHNRDLRCRAACICYVLSKRYNIALGIGRIGYTNIRGHGAGANIYIWLSHSQLILVKRKGCLRLGLTQDITGVHST